MHGCSVFFFFNDTATTEIYTLSLHDALPIWTMAGGNPLYLHELFQSHRQAGADLEPLSDRRPPARLVQLDRKSTRLNSSHANISYAVFCLKKKKKMSTP